MSDNALPRFDVALYCEDDTAILYHVPTYPELVQSLVDIAPIAGTYVRGVAVVRDGRQLSDTFTARALRATGIGRLIALAPPQAPAPLDTASPLTGLPMQLRVACHAGRRC